MTIVPNLLVTGILAIIFSLVFLAWATWFVQRKHSGLVLILLSVALLLFGGGFRPPLLGFIVGSAATRINTPFTWWHAHLSIGLRRFLGRLWLWSFVAGLIAWLLLPGSVILDYFFGVNDPNLIYAFISSAFGFLLVTIFTGFAHDSQRNLEGS